MVKESKASVTIRRRRHINSAFREVVNRQKSTCDSLDSDDDETVFIHEEVVIESPVLRQLMSSEWTLFLGLVAFRVINALVIQTSYVPDEYWQSIEVAHNVVFGYGHLTWEWKAGLRSYAYPMLIAAIYKVLAILHLDYRVLLIKLPRLLQALFAATGDLYLYKLSLKLGNHWVAEWSLLCQLTSWFTFYTATRTLTNSVESVMTTVALYYFPWPGRPRKAHWKFISVVSLCVVIRPTAAVVWLPLCSWYLYMYRHLAWKVIKMVAERGFLILTISSIIDRIFYGEWVYVHYNFLQFNVLSNMGTFYGSHPWHWYITQGFAVIMGSNILPFVLALNKGIEPIFLAVISWTILVYSCLGHKEFRFLLPVLPLAMHVCGVYLHYLSTVAWPEVQYKYASALKLQQEEKLFKITPEDTSTTGGDSENTSGDDNIVKTEDSRNPRKTDAQPIRELPIFVKYCLMLKKKLDFFYLTLEYYTKRFWQHKKYIVVGLVVTNLPLTLYTSLIHQRGTLDVMKYVSDQSVRTVQGEGASVLYLMPCHSTPYYGFVHKNISMRFLTCEPNLLNATDHIDEADVFYNDPAAWLEQESHKLAENRHAFINNKLPSHIIMFNVLKAKMEGFLTQNNYYTCARFFHTHFPEGRIGTHVIAQCRKGWGDNIDFPSNKILHGSLRL